MIVTTIDQVKKVVPNIDKQMEFEDFETFMNDAERYMKREYLGNTLYTFLDADEGTHEDTVAMLENAIILKGYYESIPFLDLRMTQNGFAVTNNQNMSPASKDRVKKLRDQTYARFDSAVEDLMDQLEATTALHDKWKGSEAFSIMYDLFVPTARELSKFIDIGVNRRLFRKIRGNVLNAQRFMMYPIISKALAEQIIEQVKDKEVSSENNAILNDLKGAAAYLGMYDALNRLSIIIDERGIVEPYSIGEGAAISEESKIALKLQWKNTGYDYIGNVMKVLNNADAESEYQAYFTSDEYANKDNHYENEADSPLFFFNG